MSTISLRSRACMDGCCCWRRSGCSWSDRLVPSPFPLRRLSVRVAATAAAAALRLQRSPQPAHAHRSATTMEAIPSPLCPLPSSPFSSTAVESVWFGWPAASLDTAEKGRAATTNNNNKQSENKHNHVIIRINCGKSMNETEEQEQESLKSRPEESALHGLLGPIRLNARDS